MAKDAYYFSHDCNAQEDPKIMVLIDKYKMTGYGVYWALIEKLRQEADYKLPLTIIPSLAKRFKVKTDILNDIVRSFGLFSYDENMFYSESLIRRMSLRAEKARNSANARWKNANALQPHEQALQNDANKGKEIKENESKENENEGNESKPQHTKLTAIDPVTTSNTVNNFYSIEDLKNRIANDDLYVSHICGKGVRDDYVYGWLNAFNIYLRFQGIYQKQEPDYRAHFANWLVKVPNFDRRHPDGYSPLKDIQPPVKEVNSGDEKFRIEMEKLRAQQAARQVMPQISE
jgi:hypothetical protein